MQKSSKKTKKTKRVNTTNDVARQAEGFSHLSHCAADYGELIVNPFVRSHTSCIPTFPVRKSRKFSTFASGSFEINTVGVAAVSFNPWKMAVADTVTAGAYPVMYTVAANTHNWLPKYGDTNVGHVYSNSDFTGVPGSLGLTKFRLVAAGLRVMYNDKLLDVGGRVAGLEEPDHESLGGMTFSDVVGYDEARQFHIQANKWYELIANPIDSSSLTYGGYTISAYDLSEFCQMACPVSGYPMPYGFILLPAGDSGTFIFEAYAHFEAIGRNVRGTTRSHSDVVGLSSVVNVTGTDAVRQPRAVDMGRGDIVNHNIARHVTDIAGRGLMSTVSRAINASVEYIPQVLEIGSSIASLASGLGRGGEIARSVASLAGSRAGQRLLLGAL